MNSHWITASEIGDYVYCKRGWWLKIHNHLPKTNTAMESGKAAHSSLFNLLFRSTFVKLFAGIFLVTGVLIMIGILLLS